MALNDALYSSLVNLYQDLDDKKIHEINARLILMLTEEISDQEKLKDILSELNIYKSSLHD